MSEPAGPLTELPNGMVVRALNVAEAATLYREIFQQRCWLTGGLRIAPGDVVFDVGANIGLTTLFLHREEPSARIYGFEPVPPAFAALTENMARHEVPGRALNVALGERSGTGTLTYYPDASSMSGLRAEPRADAELTRAYLRNSGFSAADAAELVPEAHRAVEYPCRVTTLTEAMEQLGVDRIDYLKIDAEKSEYDILRGLSTERWSAVAQVAAEVHDFDGRLDAVRNLLRDAGFSVTVRQDPLLVGTGLYDVIGLRGERGRDGR